MERKSWGLGVLQLGEVLLVTAANLRCVMPLMLELVREEKKRLRNAPEPEAETGYLVDMLTELLTGPSINSCSMDPDWLTLNSDC